MAGKVFDFNKPRKLYALKKVGENLYIKVTGSYGLPDTDVRGSCWNTKSAAAGWAPRASNEFGGDWEVVPVEVRATPIFEDAELVKIEKAKEHWYD